MRISLFPASALLFALCTASSIDLLAAPATAENPLKPRFADSTKTIWIEPIQGYYYPVSFAEKPTGKCVFSLSSSQQATGVFAVYAQNGNHVRGILPLARYQVSRLTEGSPLNRVEVSLELKNGQLALAAKDLIHKSSVLKVTRLSREEMAKATLPPVKKSTKLPAIAAQEGKPLEKSVGLRSSNGLFVPFFRAKAEPGETATVYLQPLFRGTQRTADLTVYSGENHFIENNDVEARYLLTGLSTDDKARFALKFVVTPAGKVDLVEARDTVTHKPAEIRPYSAREARRLGERIPDAPTPSTPRGFLPTSPLKAQ